MLWFIRQKACHRLISVAEEAREMEIFSRLFQEIRLGLVCVERKLVTHCSGFRKRDF